MGSLVRPSAVCIAGDVPGLHRILFDFGSRGGLDLITENWEEDTLCQSFFVSVTKVTFCYFMMYN